jgi:hypothetical protein
MEYIRDPKNQIYADLAYRMGRVVVQYEKMNTDEEKFESSLCLAVLQNLLTNSNEYVRKMVKSERENSIFRQAIDLSGWGLNKECWVKNTFNEERNLQNFVERVRNSVSHPNEIDVESRYPSTGFTTIKDDSGIVKKFRFINSPDSKKNRQKLLTMKAIEDTIYVRGKEKERIVYDEFPKDISYEKVEGDNSDDPKFYLTYNGEPFIRISIIDLTISELKTFVKNLANYLAQPIRKDWDGITIKNLIAA